MRSQALFRRSKSLLKASKIVSVSRPNPSKTPLYNAKRLSSQVSPPTDPSADPLAEPSATPPPVPPQEPPSTPLEEPDRIKTRRSRPLTSLASKGPEIPELPEDLDILWTPSLEEGNQASESTSLPPKDILEEALHNLHIALHPQTQNRAVFASPLGPPVEPSIGLYCPIEGGEYVIDATVKELARRTGAEVLVLDAVQLAAGEWGHFGPAATSLQLPRNPLHFSSSTLPAHENRTSNAPPVHEEEEEYPSTSFPPLQQMMLTFLAPSGPRTGSTVVAQSSKRAVPASKVKVFFDALVNMKSKDSSSQSNGRPRLIYIRDFPTLASTSSTWYPHLLSSIRQRRKGAMSRSSAPVPNPLAIIYGVTPPLLAQTSTEGYDGASFMTMGMNGQSPRSHIIPSKPTQPEWGEDSSSDAARERRLKKRLKKWEQGEDILRHEFPRLAAMDGSEGSSRPDVIILGSGSGSSPLTSLSQSLSDQSASAPESKPSFFRTSILVPRVRSVERERDSRISRRREINELTMRMGIGAVGGSLQPEGPEVFFPKTTEDVDADSIGEKVSEETDASVANEESQEKESSSEETQKSDKPSHPDIWTEWGNRLEMWSEVRRIADRALGSVVASSIPSKVEGKSTLERTLVSWPDVKHAWDSVNGVLGVRRSWLQEALPSALSGEEEDTAEDSARPRDAVIEEVRNDPNLDAHEQRLLSSIVDAGSMTTTFNQVHLPPHTIDSVRSIVSLPLLHPKAFQHGILKEHGMTGCLLFGPPGTGKTLVVKALAKEAGCRMMVISPSDIMDMYVGEGEKLVRALFSLARRLSPCVIFLDEMDALFGARTSLRESGSAIAHRGVITEFMQEIDGLKSSKEDSVIVIGATNRPFDLDDAVLRRLPRRLLVDLPGEKERKEILKILLRDEIMAPDFDLDALAKQTAHFSGSDLKHLCVAAALDAVKENVNLPWDEETSSKSEPQSSTTESPPQEPKTEPKTESAQEAKPSIELPRFLARRNFEKALKEITPSSSEALGSLAELRKWNEEFGEGRNKKPLIWGKGLFGFNGIPKQGDA